MSELLTEVEPLVEAMRGSFLEDVRKRIEPVIDRSWDEVSDDIRSISRSFEQTDAWRAVDLQSAIFLKLSAAILAVSRALSPDVPDRRDLLEALKNALYSAFFADGLDAYLLRRLDVSAEAPDRAWDQLCVNFIAKGEEQFGRAWIYEPVFRDDKRCLVNVRRCGFADFFLSHDARDVLYIICGADYVWADALEKYGVRMERPTMLAEGSDACRFQFFRSGA